MKRIKQACLLQTIHFQVRDAALSNDPAGDVRTELANYKAQLKRSGTQYRIVSEEVQPDQSIIIRIRKQYNSYDTGSYLDE